MTDRMTPSEHRSRRRSRRSCAAGAASAAISPTPVEPEKLRACLEAARIAPSAHNVQPWRFVVVDDPALKDRLAAAAFSGHLFRLEIRRQGAGPPGPAGQARPRRPSPRRIGSTRSPIISWTWASPGSTSSSRPRNSGLATCWMGWFDRRRVRKVLGIPRKFKVVAMMPLGYAD